MPRAADAKVWNEDLVKAFEARAQMGRLQGKSTHIGWTQAAQTIAQVRKDIYQTRDKTRTYNLPENKLKKSALQLAREIMAGTKGVLPDGYVPTTSASAQGNQDYDWNSYPYLKKIKARGGAYAILMAFHHSQTTTLTIDQVCDLAQPYCDEEMKAHYMAGRSHGAWSSNKTLLNHNLLSTDGRKAQYVQGVGFRSTQKSTYTLTRDGEGFTKAMIRKFHNGIAPNLGGGFTHSTPHGSPATASFASHAGFVSSPAQASSRKSTSAVKQKDEIELRNWIEGASVGQQKVFKVSKARRQNLHDFCDILQREMPGLGLQHESFGGGRSRALYITVTKAQHTATQSRQIKRDLLSSPFASLDPFGSGVAMSGVVQPDTTPGSGRMLAKHLVTDDKKRPSAREAAALAAFKRAAASRRITPAVERKPEPKHTSPSVKRKAEVVDLLSDDDDDNDFPPPSGLTPSKRVRNKTNTGIQKNPLVDNGSVVDLLEEETTENPSFVIALDFDDDDDDRKVAAVQNPYKAKSDCKVKKQLTFCVDERERNRNATPRRLRIELARMLDVGQLRQIWPMTCSKVNDSPMANEIQLRFGDFGFLLGDQRIDVVVERKTIGDLVQRSASGAHWKQGHKMRDNFRFAVFLIEIDPRQAARFNPHGSQYLDDERNPFETVIEDESSVNHFLCRAILSHRSIKFIQTREMQGSLRAVGALGLMAASLGIVMPEDAEAHATPDDEHGKLMQRLSKAGIPPVLACSVAREFGSAKQLQRVYDQCDSDRARSALLVPLVRETKLDSVVTGTDYWWSSALHTCFNSVHKDTSVAATSFRNFRELVSDEGQLLCVLHQEIKADAALDTVLSDEIPSDCANQPKRHVNVELAKSNTALIETPTPGAFYSLSVSDREPGGASMPTIVVHTLCGSLKSSNFVIHVVTGKFVVNEVQAAMKEEASYVTAARNAARSMLTAVKTTQFDRQRDRRVMVVRGLGPAIEAEARKEGYKPELKTVIDLVLSDLMLEHDLVVLQAFRQNNDVEFLLKRFLMTCFQCQLLMHEK